MAYVKVIPIQTLEYKGETYLISQLRICKNCHEELEITDGNHRLHFDMENRIAVHEHIKCPPNAHRFT